jgi:hypothetical protein
MRRIVTLVLAVACLVACHRSAGEAADGAPGALGGNPDDVGIAECDDYVTKVERCVTGHVPAEKKARLDDHLARTRATWKALASNPGARPGLPQACKLALQSAQTTMSEYACSW